MLWLTDSVIAEIEILERAFSSKRECAADLANPATDTSDDLILN